MVINEFYVYGCAINPTKDEAPLVVHADAEPAVQIAAQCFKAIARRRAEVLNRGGGDKHVQFAGRCAQQPYIQSRDFTR